MEGIDGLNWRKSSYSGNGGECVEVAQTGDGTILLMDTISCRAGRVRLVRVYSCTIASIVSRRAARAFADLLPAAIAPETADKAGG
jgi:hypothetical protein